VKVEVVLKEGQSEAEGQQISEEIVTKLRLKSLTPEPRSSSDLMGLVTRSVSEDK